MSSSVDIIKSKLDIVSVIGTYITLEKAGANYKGKCPFHNEKTPSFFVSVDRNTYYCFGCHAKGDIFTFVQEYEGLDFVGALKMLAQRAGVELESYTTVEKSEKEELYSVIEQAVFYFRTEFEKSQTAQEYLKLRGVTEQTIRDWSIGFAKAEWRGLYDFLLSKGFSPELMFKAGLVKRKEGTQDTFYDTFRGRIMFPIFDPAGRPVAFSGRILVKDDTSPKYVNSPETVLFNKSDTLYGLHKAKQHIREQEYAILVEGQMDLIMMHQSGFANTVASSGTALTRDHLTRLRRISPNIAMAFDGDEAGLKAITRSAHTALELGMEVKVIELPEGSDPADVLKESREKMIEHVKHSQHIIMFALHRVLAQEKDRRMMLKRVVSDVLPFVAYLQTSAEKSYFISQIASTVGVSEEALNQDLAKVTLKEQGVYVKEKPPSEGDMMRGDRVLRSVIGIYLWQKHLSSPQISYIDIEKKLIDIFGEEEARNHIAFFEKDRIGLIFETEAYYNNKDTLERDVGELLISLEEEYLKKKFAEVMIQVHHAEQEKDTERSHALLAQCQEISRRINELKRMYEKK